MCMRIPREPKIGPAMAGPTRPALPALTHSSECRV